jgi:hypothetical protein
VTALAIMTEPSPINPEHDEPPLRVMVRIGRIVEQLIDENMAGRFYAESSARSSL